MIFFGFFTVRLGCFLTALLGPLAHEQQAAMFTFCGGSFFVLAFRCAGGSAFFGSMFGFFHFVQGFFKKMHIGDFTGAIIIQRAECPEHQEDAHQHTEVAHTVGDHGFPGGIAVLPAHAAGFIKPETNQQERTQPDTFPADEHHQEIVARHQDKHECQKHVEISKKTRETLVTVHVPGSINMDECADK